MFTANASETLLDVRIRKSSVSCFVIPTESPEADGTYSWDKITLIIVELAAGSQVGFGYTYADIPTARMTEHLLRELIEGQLVLEHGRLLLQMQRSVRQSGLAGTAAMAISAIDIALWDLRAKLLNTSIAALLGIVRTGIPVYGSGGFISYSDEQLQHQLLSWKDQGIRMMKMKIGSDLRTERRRVALARATIGPDIQLFVDANGACTPKQALAFAESFRDLDVAWFEEPVSSDDLNDLHFIRDHAPAGMEIAAGEYGYTPWYFQRMLEAEAVDVLQADATRCLGISGFLEVGALCNTRQVPYSSHCAPSSHLHAMLALPAARHMEFFHSHVRIERMLFDGFCEPRHGELSPDLTRPGLGIESKYADAMHFVQ